MLASETRTDADGLERRAAQVVWIVCNGRLKRCSPDQLRHASDREAALAEAASEGAIYLDLPQHPATSTTTTSSLKDLGQLQGRDRLKSRETVNDGGSS